MQGVASEQPNRVRQSWNPPAAFGGQPTHRLARRTHHGLHVLLAHDVALVRGLRQRLGRLHGQPPAEARGRELRAPLERRALPGHGPQVVAEALGIEVAHAPGRDALDAGEARALREGVQSLLERHRVDEGRERTGGEARLAPHPDARRVNVVGFDVVLEAASRFAHRGDVLGF